MNSRRLAVTPGRANDIVQRAALASTAFVSLRMALRIEDHGRASTYRLRLAVRDLTHRRYVHLHFAIALSSRNCGLAVDAEVDGRSVLSLGGDDVTLLFPSPPSPRLRGP